MNASPLTDGSRIRSGSAAETITEPSSADKEGLARQMVVVQDLLAERWPDARLHGTAADLVLLQRLLDSGRLKADQTYELQCVGIAFSVVLAKEAGLHWVIVEDGYGRDPTIQYRNSSLILFPLTMISKRVERGERVDLSRLSEALTTVIKQRGPQADPAARPA